MVENFIFDSILAIIASVAIIVLLFACVYIYIKNVGENESEYVCEMQCVFLTNYRIHM